MFFSLYIPRRLKKRAITVGLSIIFRLYRICRSNAIILCESDSPVELSRPQLNVMNMANESNFIHQIKWRKLFFLQGGFLQP